MHNLCTWCNCSLPFVKQNSCAHIYIVFLFVAGQPANTTINVTITTTATATANTITTTATTNNNNNNNIVPTFINLNMSVIYLRYL